MCNIPSLNLSLLSLSHIISWHNHLVNVHLYVHQSRTEHGLILYIVRNPEVKARPEALPEVRHTVDAIAIVQKPDPDPRLVVEPDLAVAVEVVAVTIAEAKAAHLLPILALREVLRSW
ncbi:hypothetical protein NUH16_002354 [Penicillium rubens]|nr:hypothetical protein NUH16_002354 [Penicillium rubens]